MDELNKDKNEPATAAVNVAAIVRQAIEEFTQKEQAKNEPAHKAELQEERRKREQLERRLNELVEENRRSKQIAEEAQTSTAIRAELQRLGVSKVDLAYKAVRDDIVRGEDGRLVAHGEAGDMGVKDYLAGFVAANPEFLPARISGGSGLSSGQKAPSGGSTNVDMDRIKPGMSRDEMERVRQEIVRLASQPRTGCSKPLPRQKITQERIMPAITSANLANAIVKLVAADALPALVGNLVMGNLVNRDYEPVLAQAGDTVNIPIAPTLVANNLAEGSTVQLQNPNVGNAQIVLNTHCEATFQIPDVTKVLAVPDLLQLYMQPAVVAIAQKIESDLLALYASFTANTPVGTAGTAITEAVVDSAETALFQAMIPAYEPKFLVVDSNTYSALRQIDRFSEFQTAGEAGLRALVDGTIGKLKDFFVLRSQFISKTGSSPVTTHNLAFTKDAIGLVIRRLPQPLPGTGAIAEYAELGNFGVRVVMSYQPNTLAQQFTVDVLYGVAVLRNNAAIQVNS